MKIWLSRRVILILSFIAYLCFVSPVSAQGVLVFSAIEGVPPVNSITKILRQAYKKLGITIKIIEYPGLRGLQYSNAGETDGEAFRTAGIEEQYPNLVRIEVPIQADKMYLCVKPGKEFIVDGWESIPKNYVFGYQRGVKFAEYAVTKYEIQAESVRQPKQLILKLEAGRNDVVLLGIREHERFIKNQDIIRLEPPITINSLYHYLHIKHVALVPQITAELKKMETSGEIKKIQEQIKVK